MANKDDRKVIRAKTGELKAVIDKHQVQELSYYWQLVDMLPCGEETLTYSQRGAADEKRVKKVTEWVLIFQYQS